MSDSNNDASIGAYKKQLKSSAGHSKTAKGILAKLLKKYPKDAEMSALTEDDTKKIKMVLDLEINFFEIMLAIYDNFDGLMARIKEDYAIIVEGEKFHNFTGEQKETLAALDKRLADINREIETLETN